MVFVMRFLKTEKGINLYPEKYNKKFLEHFNMQDCKPSKTPAEDILKIDGAQDSVKVDSHEFRSLVGSPSKLNRISCGSQMSDHGSWMTQLLIN